MGLHYLRLTGVAQATSIDQWSVQSKIEWRRTTMHILKWLALRGMDTSCRRNWGSMIEARLAQDIYQQALPIMMG